LRLRGAARAHRGGRMTVERRFVALVAMAFAVAAGAALGVCAHAAYLLARYPLLPLDKALLAPVSSSREAFVLGGALVALFLASAASGLLRVRALARDLLGALTGAAAGSILYALGFLTAAARGAGAAEPYADAWWQALDRLTVALLGA